jgi:hypothetical protein
VAGTFAHAAPPTSLEHRWGVAQIDVHAAWRHRVEEAKAIESPHERALALKRLRIQAATTLASIDEAIEEAEGEREHLLIREAVSYVRDNADLREQIIERGDATPERLDAIGFVSNEDLDEAAERGELVEATYQALKRIDEAGIGGMAGGLVKWLEKLHPRDRGGKFAKKPGSGMLERRVGRDSRTDHTPDLGRDSGGSGRVKRKVKAPAAKKPERVFKTQDVKPEELAVQDQEGLVPGQRPAGMSRAQAKQERERTPEGQRRLRGQVQSEEEIADATAKDREKRTKDLEKRTDKSIKSGLARAQGTSEGTPHWNEADEVSQRTLLDYVRNALTTPSTADAHGEVRDGKRVYHPDRAQLHDAIIDVLLRRRNEDRTLSATNEYLPSQDAPSVLFMGGGYAAGKSSARKILEGRGEVPPDALTIDPDQIKSMLPEFAATAAHDPEANLRVYEEAWDVAQELQRRAQERKLNIIVDGITNTSVDEVIGRVEGFRDAGYGEPRIAYVDVPTDVALKRAADRATKAAKEGDGPNMRHIPEPIMRAVHRDVAATIPALMADPRRGDLGLAIEVYDGQEGALPIATAAPDARTPEVHHDPAWTRLREKSGEQIGGVDAPESSTDPYAQKREGELGDEEGVEVNHEDYFNVTSDTPRVPLNKLRPSKPPESQPQSVDNAEKFMDLAAKGEKDKRDPIKVRAESDGTYTVLDGNATYGAAVRKNWRDLPVEVTNADTAEVTPEARPEDDPRTGVVGQALQQVLSDPALAGLTKDAEAMPWSTEEEVYAQAPDVHEEFSRVLDMGEGVSAKIGAEVHSSASKEEFDAILEKMQANPDVPHIIIGGIKGAKRAREKVDTKYGGNWAKLHDVVRGTVVVPSLDRLQEAVDSVRADAEARGWSVSAVENRMVSLPGQPDSGPTGSGYSDFNIKLRSPDGFQTELQFNSVPMMLAKEGEGHALYEQERTIIANALKRNLPLNTEERARLEDLRRKQRALYTTAWQESLGGSST